MLGWLRGEDHVNDNPVQSKVGQRECQNGDWGDSFDVIKSLCYGLALPDAPDAASLLAKYGVDYVVIDPQEHSLMPVNAAFFSRYPEVGSTGEYHLYKITR